VQDDASLPGHGAVTGSDGSFTLPVVFTGLACELTFERQGERLGPPSKPVALAVGPGETKDLGSLTVTREGEQNHD
jgi:hypothetical protein